MIREQSKLRLMGIGALVMTLLAALFPAVPNGVWREFQLAWENTVNSKIESKSQAVEEVRVSRVIDGDTFEIQNGEKVRLIGIDAPESVKPNTKVQCFGKEASQALTELLTGEPVRLERDVSDRDRYGRLLRYVYLGDEFLNERLVRDGLARAKEYPPDTRAAAQLNQAENEARQSGRGLWNLAACPR